MTFSFCRRRQREVRRSNSDIDDTYKIRTHSKTMTRHAHINRVAKCLFWRLEKFDSLLLFSDWHRWQTKKNIMDLSPIRSAIRHFSHRACTLSVNLSQSLFSTRFSFQAPIATPTIVSGGTAVAAASLKGFLCKEICHFWGHAPLHKLRRA